MSTEEGKVEPFLKLEPVSSPGSSVNSYRGRGEKPKCAVCHEDGDGLHFGAEACRACTAFFRRSVALNKTYRCRVDGHCEITSNIRCMCRSCRYDKCIDVGMHPEFVQNRRETIGKRDEDPVKSITSPPSSASTSTFPTTSSAAALLDFSLFKSESPSSFTAFSLPASLPGLVITPSLESMPLLERMMINYKKMENARSVIHRLEGENIFQQKVPREINFRQATEVTTKEVSLVADWIEWCFDDFSVLPVAQKTILFQNFFIYFSMLEKAFMTVRSGRDNVVVMASKDYINYANLENFFTELDKEKSASPEECLKLILPSFELQKKSLFNLMRIENVDIYEFFALCVLLFWDFGLEGQSDECNEVGRKVKQRVTREMTFYLKHVKKHEEPLCRLAAIVSILPTLQASALSLNL
ncbi:unnamed protein product [Caenorhabditis sp. 36 PRJEB53466]|nr:unnamed protein product [Caenorhabditis sp. 36 PRJEB53466]